MGDWTLAPIVRFDDNGGAVVHSLLALVDSSAVPDTSIKAVWYSRDGGGAWAGKTWDAAKWEAIKFVKESLAIGDEFDGMWPTWDDPAGIPLEIQEIPKDYVSGLAEDDPLLGLLTTPDRDLLIEVLVAVGYKAADIPFEKTVYAGQCGSNVVLEAFAVGVEAGLEVQPASAAVAVAEAAQAALATSCGSWPFCLPYVTKGPWTLVLPSAWTPSPWAFDFCSPTVGGCSACTYHCNICRAWTRTWVFV